MLEILPILSTVIVFVSFVGIVVWACSGKRKADFDQAANVPLDDDGPAPVNALKESE